MPEIERPANLILAALPEESYRGIVHQLKRVELQQRQRLYGSGDAFTHVYFIESGVVSIMVGESASATVEIASIGREGMVGLPVHLGVKIANNRAIVQVAGEALRMTTRDFLTACARHEDLPRILRSFTYSVMVQLSRAAICNRFHSIDGRLARWLLTTRDRMRSNEFSMTQESLAYLLGVRREAVNRAATTFQKESLVSYVRGRVQILNGAGLEALACDCYSVPPHI